MRSTIPLRGLSFLALWFAHAGASIAAFLWYFTVSSSRFDGHRFSSAALRLSSLACDVLWFPLAKPLTSVVQWPGSLGWLPVGLNSALWVIALALALRWRLSNRRPHKSAP
ncbi:MAG: hypothetical protein Q7T97_18375 [Burkholderiaceae bacterium]|nr:hypothetical protein [Burkholderiaceae bacterium]